MTSKERTCIGGDCEYSKAVSMPEYQCVGKCQYEGDNTAGRKLSLWFFRDLSGEQRGKLFGLFGMTDAQRDTNHGYQAMALAQVVSALSTLPIAVEGKVKALEWHESLTDDGREQWHSNDRESITVMGKSFSDHERYWLFHAKKGFPSLQEAKAAAQTDYETRILSALVSSPGNDGGQSEVEELREKLSEAEALIEDRDSQMALIDRIADLIGLPHDQELDQVAFELWFSKTVSNEGGQKVEAARALAFAEVEQKAREWAEHYPYASDGRNTFIMFAEWAEEQASSAKAEETDR